MRHGSRIDPPNRFESVQQVPDLEHLEWDQEYLNSQSHRKVEYLSDATEQILAQNNSPDIPFRYSINPYRGCVHACAYCYARPTHEYLGFNAGLDFETKIMVKEDAPELLRKELAKPRWQAETIVFSGVTDCYQPAERDYQLTRSCLQIASDCHQPIGIITKNALVMRDLDLLASMAKRKLVHVFLSITTLRPDLARDMEPRTSIPAARFRAVKELAAAGVPVGVMVSPVIPGLNDEEIPELLRQAAAAGARTANYIMLRLPLTVEPVFREWIERTQPNQAEKTLNRLRSLHEGELYRSEFGTRQRGSGPWAEMIRQTFRLFQQKHGLDAKMPELDRSNFQPPTPRNGQQWLF